MWQTNNPVDALAVANGVLYAGGQFTAVRPPGTSSSSSSAVSRTYLAAFDASTGALITSFAPTLNGRVYDIKVSPDGGTVYVAGSFSTVNGSSRGHVAAFSTSTGALLSFDPKANKMVSALAVTSSRVYLSGEFTKVGSTTSNYIASVGAVGSSTAGSVDTAFSATLVAPAASQFTANPSARALSMVVTPDNQRLLVGGGFEEVNGVTTGGMASLDPATGAVQSWPANDDQSINLNCSGRVRAIVLDGDSAYVTAEGDPPGCYEGTYRANFTTGEMVWNSSCLGAGQGLAVVNGILYKGSHMHDCAFNLGDARGGFVGGTARENFMHHYLAGQNVADGSFVHWTPQTNAAGTGGVGPHVLATDGSQIFVGGDFTKVNGDAQQGLARFSSDGNQATPKTPGVSYNSDPFSGATSIIGANLAITVQPTAANTLTVEVPTVEDADSGTLTYRIYRDGGSTAIATLTAESYPWSRPVLRYDDTGLAAGSSHSYRVTASDGVHTSSRSTAVSGTVASSAPPTYSSTMSGTSPSLWWRLDDSGATLADSSGNGQTGTEQGGVTADSSGPMNGDQAAKLNGSTGYLASSSALSAPGAFSEGVWFKTTSIYGGVLLAQTDSATGDGNTDRTIAMDNNGGLVFLVKGTSRGGPFGPSVIKFRNQGPIWNDGTWHYAVGTYDGAGSLSLYVDGQLQGTTSTTTSVAGMSSSYLRSGYADVSAIQMVFGVNYYNHQWPASEYFNGSVDEPAMWNYQLSAAQVAALFAAGVGEKSVPVNQAPTASFTTSVSGGNVQVDASASSDADGTIASYSWDWGDGSTASSGSTSSHTYSTAGSKTITLTVTDDDGATDTTTRTVSVTPATETTTTLVPYGSQWRWKYDADGAPSDWNTLGADVSSWNQGAAILGFNASDVTTDIDTFSSTSDRPLAAYFVKNVTIPQASSVVKLTLTGLANDGVVVYVNGTEVTRSNMRDGTITAKSYAASARNETTAQANPFTVDVPVGLLVNGTNVIAAETHLNYRATRDAAFDLQAEVTTTG
ncbi:MAG: PKD domain-containing protein [Nocardioides sp.]|uniref:PKD domain-containing protein n=1 Tax=Nocardioides sp. TaxID=35761 RepID=UPI0039E6B51A